MLPFFLIFAQFDITRTFLNCFEKTNVAMVIQLVTTTLHIVWSYIFITYFEMKLVGTAISNTLTAVLNLATILIYTSYNLPELKEAWFFPGRDSFTHLGEYLKVSIPTMLMVCLEWWTFEIQTFFASFISVDSTGAQVIILNTIYIYFCFTLGIQVAGYVLVGKAIGA